MVLNDTPRLDRSAFLILPVMVPAFYIAFIPHQNYPYPLHVDEWLHLAYSEALLEAGEEGTVILGIVNRENEAASYRVEIKMDGDIADILEPIFLEPAEKYEQLVSFTPSEPGDEQMVEFLLYKQGQIEVYESPHLRVDVE